MRGSIDFPFSHAPIHKSPADSGQVS
jgi:hypothetical protein